MGISERRVQEIGKSFLISLPKGWTRTVGVKKGTLLKINVSEKGNLTIAPEFIQTEKPAQASIEYDEYFTRRFFREYFHASERITIVVDPNISEASRKELYTFLKKFMNVQIIEETKTKVVVKCFRIDELSIEECLRRMHFLALGMLDEAAAGKNLMKLMEMRETTTRFYYLLVMQVRRFLSEGEFTKENQIPLIRALDFRMVAEKLHRITAIILSGIDLVSIKKTRGVLDSAIGCFLKEDFEGSLKIWQELCKECERLSKAVACCQDTTRLRELYATSEILRLTKGISSLVR